MFSCIQFVNSAYVSGIERKANHKVRNPSISSSSLLSFIIKLNRVHWRDDINRFVCGLYFSREGTNFSQDWKEDHVVDFINLNPQENGFW